MCTGIALPTTELPVALAARHRLSERVYCRAGRDEFRFFWTDIPTVLPVRWEGRVEVLPWGSKLRRGPLPYGGWVSAEHVAAGILGQVEEAVIPAALGFERGTWFVINEGVRAVVVAVRGGPVVYLLIAPSTNYYRNMTEQSPMMPVLVHQVI